MNAATAANSYFGTLRRRLQTPSLRIGEYAYPGHYRIARHSHEQPFISLVLEGKYRERVGAVTSEIAGPAAVVHAAGECHQDEFAAQGGVIFSIDMPGDWFHAAALRDRAILTGPHVRTAARRVTREMRRRGEAAPWFVESAILHLVGSLERAGERGRRARIAPGGWVKQVAECLQDNYARKPSLAELARLAGVHPVHVARQFQKAYACTIGDYVRTLRVERAVADLVGSAMSLAEVASAHGFADQSHLSRLVREHTGRTPGEWRRAPT